MGLAARLNLAFIAVILVMVVSHAAYSLVVGLQSSRARASQSLDAAHKQLADDFKQIATNNLVTASAIANSQAFLTAYTARDRKGMSRFLQDFIRVNRLVSSITIVSPNGKVFFDTETPNKSGYSVKESSRGIQEVLTTQAAWKGTAAFGLAGNVYISSMTPVRGAQGVVAVNQPVNSAFLTGLATGFELDPTDYRDIDLALFDVRRARVTAVSSGLVKGSDGGFISRLNNNGASKLPKGVIEESNRLWKPLDMTVVGDVVAVVLLTTPVPNIMPHIAKIAGQAAVSGGIAIAIGFFVATVIGGSITASLRFLIQRAKDLAANRRDLEPLDRLQGDWLELGELIDTAVTSMRSSVQSLKSHASKHSEELRQALGRAKETTSQLAEVNRQLDDRTRQMGELGKQLHWAHHQAVVLQQKLCSVLQISTEGFLMLDQYGNVLSANPVFLNWMGVPEAEIAGRFCFDLVKRPGEKPENNEEAEAFARHSGDPGDLINQFYPEGVIYHRMQDKSVKVLAHLHPVVAEDGSIESYVMVLRDKSLRSEVSQLRTEIVAMLSDSIRAPLMNAQRAWKAVLSSAIRSIPSSTGQTLMALHSQYEQLLGLVDNLLMMYGGVVTPFTLPHEQALATRLVADCLEETAAPARQHQLTLDYKTVTGLPPIKADRETLKSVLIQLLEKMISITAPGGRVRVESTIKGQLMRIGVSSSGPALPQEEIEDMFVGFVEGKHKEDTYSLRLSMYLARNNVERLGGSIWAESESGRGTIIYLTLPVA